MIFYTLPYSNLDYNCMHRNGGNIQLWLIKPDLGSLNSLNLTDALNKRQMNHSDWLKEHRSEVASTTSTIYWLFKESLPICLVLTKPVMGMEFCGYCTHLLVIQVATAKLVISKFRQHANIKPHPYPLLCISIFHGSLQKPRRKWNFFMAVLINVAWVVHWLCAYLLFC